MIWQSTIRQDTDLTPFQLGITVTGRNAGSYQILGTGSLVLTTFGRSNAGTVRGDQEIADRYLNLFFRIQAGVYAGAVPLACCPGGDCPV